MNAETDIRWQQRFSNYNKALVRLSRFVQKEDLNELEKQGLIKSFEYTYELAWKTLQDLLKEKGFNDVVGPKPVIDKSFLLEYIKDGNEWVRMHKSRNLTSHVYDESIADEIANNIKIHYIALFKDLQKILDNEKNNSNNSLFTED